MGHEQNTVITKPGYKTSEFWIMVVNQVVGILVMLGYISPSEADELGNAIVSVIGGMLVIISFALYLWGRVQVKSSAGQSISDNVGVPSAGETMRLIEQDPSGRSVPINSR